MTMPTGPRSLPSVYLEADLSPGLVVLRYEGDAAMWTLSKLRKPNRCVLTGRDLDVGTEAWRPVGNQAYRARRIAPEVIEGVRREIAKESTQRT